MRINRGSLVTVLSVVRSQRTIFAALFSECDGIFWDFGVVVSFIIVVGFIRCCCDVGGSQLIMSHVMNKFC